MNCYLENLEYQLLNKRLEFLKNTERTHSCLPAMWSDFDEYPTLKEISSILQVAYLLTRLLKESTDDADPISQDRIKNEDLYKEINIIQSRVKLIEGMNLISRTFDHHFNIKEYEKRANFIESLRSINDMKNICDALADEA